MKLILPTKLFGRIYKPLAHPCKARLKTLWTAGLPVPPPAYDVDSAYGFTIPRHMWLNDSEGDCVIAARANQQTRFLAGELGRLFTISDDDVQREYMFETGGQDTGLVPDDSLALWQSRGWPVTGLNTSLSIAAWGRVDATDMLDVQRCVSLLQGMQLSMQLPNSWSGLLSAGEAWDAPKDPEDPNWQLGSWGGHQVYVKKYDATGVTCLTWGQEQLITWPGLAWIGSVANMGEAEGVVRQNEATLVPMDGLNVPLLQQELTYIAKN